MSSTVYTLMFNDTPAQLIGILWDSEQGGDTGLAVIRLRNEGRYLRVVHPSKLRPASPADLRPLAPPKPETGEESNG